MAYVYPSNADASGVFRFPMAVGFVSVCFSADGSTSLGELTLNAHPLRPNTTGGVHIHSGESCASAAAQGGHYFDTVDPWFNAVDPAIAPTGTGYTTDSTGRATAQFLFGNGYGYDATLGKVVVIHDTTQPEGDYARIACGVLVHSHVPSRAPSAEPSSMPSDVPSALPNFVPSEEPSSSPSNKPSGEPSLSPSDEPSNDPSSSPSDEPSVKPSMEPSMDPSAEPSDEPSSIPTGTPSKEPSDVPSMVPTKHT